VRATWFIQHQALWGALFWSAVVIRMVVEFANAARQPSGEAALPERNTHGAIWGFALLCTFAAFPIGFRLSALAMPGDGRAYVVAGVALMVLGTGFRQWAVHTLGRFFTFQLTVRTDQKVVDSGPYRMLRHPSYTGMLVTALGTGVAIGNWLSVALTFVPYTVSLVRRIRVEEAMLRQGLGSDYEHFAARRKRLLPGVW
jgi:protein-S-isoprenylcysteine O-methyltransferase Ste14